MPREHRTRPPGLGTGRRNEHVLRLELEISVAELRALHRLGHGRMGRKHPGASAAERELRLFALHAAAMAFSQALLFLEHRVSGDQSLAVLQAAGLVGSEAGVELLREAAEMEAAAAAAEGKRH